MEQFSSCKESLSKVFTVSGAIIIVDFNYKKLLTRHNSPKTVTLPVVLGGQEGLMEMSVEKILELEERRMQKVMNLRPTTKNGL